MKYELTHTGVAAELGTKLLQADIKACTRIVYTASIGLNQVYNQAYI
jgi:hypothetical protein